MSAIPDGRAVEDLRTAGQILRGGNTWISRSMSTPLAELLEAAADLVEGGAAGGAAGMTDLPVVVRALVVAGVVTGRPTIA